MTKIPYKVGDRRVVMLGDIEGHIWYDDDGYTDTRLIDNTWINLQISQRDWDELIKPHNVLVVEMIDGTAPYGDGEPIWKLVKNGKVQTA
jgi:hypothetical protein